MLIMPYSPDELKLAWCNRVYVRWHTYRRIQIPEWTLWSLDVAQAIGASCGLRILELATTPSEIMMVVSLTPSDTVSRCVSQLKGATCRWMRNEWGLTAPRLLGRGYYAHTHGHNDAVAIANYLERQKEHHGYDDRWARPPIFVRTYPFSLADENRVQPYHALASLRYHLVFSTMRRCGVFSDVAAEAVSECWRAMLVECRSALLKVSIVPDHAHLAIRCHPLVCPIQLVLKMLNASQVLMWEKFEMNVIRGGAERLWTPGAYLGSYGDLTSSQLRRYLAKWHRSVD